MYFAELPFDLRLRLLFGANDRRPAPGIRLTGLPGRGEQNRAWAIARAVRVDAHAQRVDRELRRRRRGRHGETRRQTDQGVTNGRCQVVWCVELCRPFPSLSAAAAFVERAASNVLQAINLHVRCGGFHWERYDPQRHGGDVHAINPQERTPAARRDGAAMRDWRSVVRELGSDPHDRYARGESDEHQSSPRQPVQSDGGLAEEEGGNERA